MGTLKLDLELNKRNIMKKLIICILVLSPILVFSQNLTNNTNIAITKTWPQEPSGWTYPIAIDVPNTPVPQGGFPVCIALHGNGGNGNNSLNQFKNILDCHIVVAPSGYMNSWNISDENSEAPDVEMVTDLINQLQTYSNINPNKIRIAGTSNGAALANRILIENDNSGIDIICAIVSQLSECNYHNNNFHSPSAATGGGAPDCGYDIVQTPLSGRKYLSICNSNDPLIPYQGGASVGVVFLDAQLSTYIIAKSQGYQGVQLTGSGNPIGNGPTVAFEYSYLSDQVVHLKGNANHGLNNTLSNYIHDYFEVSCSSTSIDENLNQNISISPNPGNNQIKIKGIEKLQEADKIIIYNSRGIQEFKKKNNSEFIDISKLNSGIYFISIYHSNGVETIKFIKK